VLSLLLTLAGAGAQAATITFSDVSSDSTPVSELDGTADFAVGDFDGGNAGDELQITLSNAGTGTFNIVELYWNADASVTSLTLLSATHSANGDVFGVWDPVATGQMADGFGVFDFSLTDGVGEMSPGIVMPGQDVVFILDIGGTGPFDMNDFIQANGMGFIGAAKFTNGPPVDDSAFGAVVPEPGTFSLLAGGLALLAASRLRRRSR